VAVVGVAIAGPVTGAGAATNDTSAPAVGIAVDLGTGPIVTIGGTPRPGITATAPVDGHVTGAIGTPTVPTAAGSLVGTAGPTLAPFAPFLTVGSAGRLVDADVTLHACIAAALLGGRDPVGCGLPVGSPTPSLAEALARVGVCARAAVLAAAPVTPCGATPSAGSSGDNAAVPPSLVGLDTDTQACLAATVLGLADPSRCSTTVDGAGSDGNGSGTTNGATDPGATGATSVGDRAVCLGLAVLTATDGNACDEVAGEQVGNGSVAGTTGAEPLALATEAAGGSGDGSDALAFTGANSVLLTLAGLGSVAGGFVIRRATRARLLT
jgi:hypothetical protein